MLGLRNALCGTAAIAAAAFLCSNAMAGAPAKKPKKPLKPQVAEFNFRGEEVLLRPLVPSVTPDVECVVLPKDRTLDDQRDRVAAADKKTKNEEIAVLAGMTLRQGGFGAEERAMELLKPLLKSKQPTALCLAGQADKENQTKHWKAFLKKGKNHPAAGPVRLASVLPVMEEGKYAAAIKTLKVTAAQEDLAGAEAGFLTAWGYFYMGKWKEAQEAGKKAFTTAAKLGNPELAEKIAKDLLLFLSRALPEGALTPAVKDIAKHLACKTEAGKLPKALIVLGDRLAERGHDVDAARAFDEARKVPGAPDKAVHKATMEYAAASYRASNFDQAAEAVGALVAAAKAGKIEQGSELHKALLTKTAEMATTLQSMLKYTTNKDYGVRAQKFYAMWGEIPQGADAAKEVERMKAFQKSLERQLKRKPPKEPKGMITKDLVMTAINNRRAAFYACYQDLLHRKRKAQGLQRVFLLIMPLEGQIKTAKFTKKQVKDGTFNKCVLEVFKNLPVAKVNGPPQSAKVVYPLLFKLRP